MSLLSNAPPETPPNGTPAKAAPAAETPPKGDTAADPKASGSPAAASNGAGDSHGRPTAPSTEAGSSAPITTPKVAPTKAQHDFEAKLEELATLDLSVKQRAKAIDLAKAKLDRFTPIDEHLTKKEYRAAVKALLGEAYTPDLLLELADDFAPTEVPVEEQVKRAFEAEKKVQEETAKKKADDQAENARLAVETETKAYLTATADFLRKNQDKYPMICAWDGDPDIDHERIIDKAWRDHYARTGQIPDPDKVLEQVEAAHVARIKKTKYWPQEPTAPSLEEATGYKAPETAAPDPFAAPREIPRVVDPNRRISGAEEAAQRLAAYDREQQQRAMLSYGR